MTNQPPVSDADADRKWTPIYLRLDAVPKLISEKKCQKNHQLRIHKVDNRFTCGPKAFVFGSQNPSMGNGLHVVKNIYPTQLQYYFVRD